MKRKLNLFNLLLIALSVTMMSSCVTMSTMQDARTLGKGNSEINAGGSTIKYDFESESGGETSVKGGIIDVDYRYGVTEELDLGIRMSLLGTSGAYAKYQFLGNSESKIAGSIGGGIGLLRLTSTVNDEDFKTRYIDVSIPAYFSYHPADWVSIYTAPRYTMRSAKSSGESGSVSHWYGGTGGLRLGRRVAFFAEYSLFDSKIANKPLTQITGGLSFGFGG